MYIYGDFCSGNIWGLRVENRGSDVFGAAATRPQLIGRASGQISSFGEDSDGNLYAVMFGGQIGRLVLAD